MDDKQELMRHIGGQIRKARQEQEITPDKMASELGVTTGHYRHMEYGVKLPSMELFISICQKLCISPVFLLAPYVQDLQSQYDEGFWTRLKGLTETQKKKLITIMDTLFGMDPVKTDQKQRILAVLELLLEDDAAMPKEKDPAREEEGSPAPGSSKSLRRRSSKRPAKKENSD